MLHVIKKSPFSTKTLDECLCYVMNDDAILFIQDAVVSTANVHMYSNKLLSLDSRIKLYTLSEDLLARGLSCQVGNTVNYNQFVELTVVHEQVQTWG